MTGWDQYSLHDRARVYSGLDLLLHRSCTTAHNGTGSDLDDPDHDLSDLSFSLDDLDYDLSDLFSV